MSNQFTFKVVIRERAGDGRTFDVVIIQAGKSLNSDRHPETNQMHRRFYPPDMLASAETIALFEGAPVRAIRLGASIEDMDHTPDEIRKELLSMNQIGVLEGVHFGEGALRSRLALHEGAVFMAGLLKQSVDMDDPVLGLSIDTQGHIEFTAHEGEVVAAVTALHGPASVDVVSRPAAGGEIVRLAASLRKENPMPEDVKTPQSEPAQAVPTIDVAAIVKEASEKARADVLADLKAKQDAKDAVLLKIKECETLLNAKLKESNLTESVQIPIRKHFAGSTFEESELDEWIADARTTLTESDKSGEVVGTDVHLGTEEIDRRKLALYDMFMANSLECTRIPAREACRKEGLEPIASLHRFVREGWGLDLQDGIYGDAKAKRKLTESLTTSSWTDIFGDTMHKALMDAYNDNDWQDWRKIVRVQPLKDFQTQHTIRMGGFANVPTVGEGQNYTAMTSPTDEEHEWTPTKRGGTEDLTREMILADDVMAISRIPVGLAYSAARTLYEFVFDQLTVAGQPTMDYDSTALFNTGRASNDNLGTTALSAAEVAVVWLAMQKFTDMSSDKREAIRPRWLLVPVDLAKTADDILKPLSVFAPGETTNQSFVRGMNLDYITVQHWTNAKDHVYVADPALVPGFLMGFVGGRQEPEMFVQDGATFGSVFNRDAITYKIRHEYGGSPIDHRPFYQEDVA